MKLLLKQYKDLQEYFLSSNSIQLTEETYLKYQDVIKCLKMRGYITLIDASTLSGKSYVVVKNAEFDEFYKWLKYEIRNERKLKRREWIIAIVSAISER